MEKTELELKELIFSYYLKYIELLSNEWLSSI